MDHRWKNNIIDLQKMEYLSDSLLSLLPKDWSSLGNMLNFQEAAGNINYL